MKDVYDVKRNQSIVGWNWATSPVCNLCCSTGPCLYILGSSEMSLCPGSYAAHFLDTYGVCGDLHSFLSEGSDCHLLGLAQHSYVTGALMKVMSIFSLAFLPFSLNCRMRIKLLDCDNSAFQWDAAVTKDTK